MISYVLDTDILTLYGKGHPQVCPRVDSQPAGTVGITVISVEEQLSGWYTRVRKARNAKELAGAYEELAKTAMFHGRWPILSFTERAIARLQQLKSLKLKVGSMDLSIAASTLENSAILVSRNLRDFQRVPGLPVEDWSL